MIIDVGFDVLSRVSWKGLVFKVVLSVTRLQFASLSRVVHQVGCPAVATTDDASNR